MICRRNIAALVLLVSAASASSWAHEFMTGYVAHEVRLAVGSVNIDIFVDLTFNELVSLEERRKLDRNQDGRIDSDESAGYLAGLASSLARGLRLTIDGHPVEVFTLYEPQLDLLGADRVTPAHHVLRLAFFARTPSTFAAGQNLLLQDALWADAPALCSFQVTGAEGFRVSLASEGKILSQPGAGASDRIVLIKAHDIS